jgi:hypothetical protein
VLRIISNKEDVMSVLITIFLLSPPLYYYTTENANNTLKSTILTYNTSLCGKLLKLKAGQGDDTVVIQIHQNVLSRNSEFFKRIVKPEWAELRDDPDTIDMGPEHSADEVKYYAHWLYSGTIPTRDFDHVNGTKSDPIWIDLVPNSCINLSKA